VVARPRHILLTYTPIASRDLVAVDRLTCVRTLTRLLDALATPAGLDGTEPGSEAFTSLMELWFQFALLWSVGGSLDEDGRKRFDTFMR